MIDAPSAELRNRPQDGISWVQKVAAVELGTQDGISWVQKVAAVELGFWLRI